MAYYSGDNWAATQQKPSWEQQQQQSQSQPQVLPSQQQQQQQQQPPSRSATASAGARDESNAFASQIAEVEKAIDNLMKSGKFPMGFPNGPRRDVMAMGPMRTYDGFGPHVSGGPRPAPTGNDFDGMRHHSGSHAQNFYQHQRFGGPTLAHRQGDPDQAAQARRRVAAQRERELRNYHQEQQYQKHITGPQSERSMSPAANTNMTEEGRRELIARQHRALYGEGSSIYADGGSGFNNVRSTSGDARHAANNPRSGPPVAFGIQQHAKPADATVHLPSREIEANPSLPTEARGNNPSPSVNALYSNNHFNNAQQKPRTSNTSPTGGSPPREGLKQSTTAPIGTRPPQGIQPPSGSVGVQKRSTTPLPSPLSFGFSSSDSKHGAERSTSASSNPPNGHQETKGGVALGWGSNSGVWGTSNGGLGVKAPVWG